jgi:hypothetical protein
MQEREVFMEATEIAFQEAGQSMTRRENKVFWQDRREFIEPVLDNCVVHY